MNNSDYFQLPPPFRKGENHGVESDVSRAIRIEWVTENEGQGSTMMLHMRLTCEPMAVASPRQFLIGQRRKRYA